MASNPRTREGTEEKRRGEVKAIQRARSLVAAITLLGVLPGRNAVVCNRAGAAHVELRALLTGLAYL